jgi:hypothetical protein
MRKSLRKTYGDPVGTPTDASYVRDWFHGVENEGDGHRVLWALGALLTHLQGTSVDRLLDELTGRPETYPFLSILGVCVTPNGQAFRSDSEGFLPGILGRLYRERKRNKNEQVAALKRIEEIDAELHHQSTPDAALMSERTRLKAVAIQKGLAQNSQKVGLNSAYGAQGNQYFRFFDTRHAEAVTLTGQLIIRRVAEYLNRHLNVELGTTRDYTVYSDTDSVYVTLAPLVDQWAGTDQVSRIDAYCEETLQPVIDQCFQDLHAELHTAEPVLAMKREAIAEYGLWMAKKRYLLWVHDVEGVRYEKPKLKITGIEAVRSSTPKYAQSIIKRAMELFIQGRRDEFYALMDEAEEAYLTRPFEEIASPRSCNGLDKYDCEGPGFVSGTPIHVKGAMAYNRHLVKTGLTEKYPTIRNGEKIRFCYLRAQNPLHCNVIAAPHALPVEWNLEQFLDRSEQFEKTLVAPIEAIISQSGWSVRPQTTLF